MPTKIFRSDLVKLVEVLKESNLPPDEFTFDKSFSTNGAVFELPLRIEHKSTGFYFHVGSIVGQFSVTRYPGIQPTPSTTAHKEWPRVLASFQAWLNRLKVEISQPDPWVLLNQGRMLTNEIPEQDEQRETFNPQELKTLHEFISSIRQTIVVESDPSESDLKLIDEKLKYLEEAAKRQTKRDWAHTAIGVMFTIAIGLSMAPDQANKLLQLTSEFLRTIFMKLLT